VTVGFFFEERRRNSIHAKENQTIQSDPKAQEVTEVK